MENEESIYHKCGEIFLDNTKTYTFLCYYCNELFYEFAEFKNHSLLHLNGSVDVLNNCDPIGSKLEANPDFINTEVLEDQEEFFNDWNQTEIKNEKINDLNNVEITHSTNDLTINAIKIEISENDSFGETTKTKSNEIFCPHCKIFFKCSLHDVKKCSKIQEVISKYKGDFIKLLREGILCCCNCHRYFEDYKKLYEHHIKAKHCVLNEQCKICKFYTFMNSKKKINILNKNENKSKIEFQKSCQECSCYFSSKAEYNEHFKLVHKKGNKNNHDDEDSEEDHTDTFENSNFDHSSYTCRYCAQEFKEKSQLEMHVLSHDEDEVQFKCSLCDRIFRKKSQLKLHMRIHTNERPYKCGMCPSAFTVSANLRTHIIYKHTDDRPFICDFEGCGAKFKLFNLKRQHEKRHLPANFQCEMCGNDYKTRFNLLKHQQSRHVDAQDWPHQCEICQKRFAQREYLVEHKRIHTGEKPFGCDQCPKFFRKRNALREHKKLHSDERKYVCRLCGKGFKQVAGYWGHMKRHPIIS